MWRASVLARRAVLWLAVFPLLSGCGTPQTASTPSKGPTIQEVLGNPQAHAGATVTWQLVPVRATTIMGGPGGDHRLYICVTPERSAVNAEVTAHFVPGAEELSPGYTYDITGKVEPPGKLRELHLSGCTATKHSR
jgi:hypothetical protein